MADVTTSRASVSGRFAMGTCTHRRHVPIAVPSFQIPTSRGSSFLPSERSVLWGRPTPGPFCLLLHLWQPDAVECGSALPLTFDQPKPRVTSFVAVGHTTKDGGKIWLASPATRWSTSDAADVLFRRVASTLAGREAMRKCVCTIFSSSSAAPSLDR